MALFRGPASSRKPAAQPAAAEAPSRPPGSADPSSAPAAPSLKGLLGWLARRFEAGQPVVGIDLGATSVKAARVESFSDGVRLTGIAVEELPLEVTEGPAWEQAVQEALQRLRRRRFLNGRIVLGFYHIDSFIEPLRMPAMPAAELAQAVVWEAKERLALDPERSVIRFVVNGQLSGNGQSQQEVLIVAAPKSALLARWKLLSDQGLKVAAMEPVPLASFYSMERLNPWKPAEVVGLLEVGMRMSHLSFIRDHAVRFSRSFPVAGDSFTRCIADYCQIDYQPGEQMKRQYGISRMALEEDRQELGHSKEDRVRVSHALGLHLEKLVAEIEQSYRYFAFELGGSESPRMDRLLLTGGGSLLRNLGEFLSDRLSVPVGIPDPLEGFEVDPSIRNSLKAGWIQRLAVPIGLALRPME
ncbi:MAG: pilus assembly protein PilM [Candidatus Omnitrophica bacterium]|nr:pilus assembly protein PilM [Candidatus Omnitrophota bacterium]